eukprot:11072025-Karenia_brevis.AAC.1
MLRIVFDELQTQPKGPIVILGDLNAEPQDIPTLQAHLDQGDFVDLGAHPNFNKGTVANTCYAPNSTGPTRRDY